MSFLRVSSFSTAPTSSSEQGAPDGVSWAVPLCWAGAALCLSNAIQLRLGFYHPKALLWIALALTLAFASTIAPKNWLRGARGEKATLAFLGAALAWQFWQLTGKRRLAVFEAPMAPSLQMAIIGALVMGAILVALGYWPPIARNYALDRARFCAVLAAHFVCGALVIIATPAPVTDVWAMQQHACRALLEGANPYAITIPDTFQGRSNYGPILQHDGRLWFGYCYLPGSLLMALPGYLLAGDHRYSQLAAITGAAALMAFARPGRISFAAASVFLFMPRMFFVIEQAWTEPFILLALCALLYAHCRAAQSEKMSSLGVVGLGLLLATKQYVIFALPLLVMLKGRPGESARPRVSFFLPAFALAATLTLPFVLWNVGAFGHSAVRIYTLFPPSNEALSFLTWLRLRELPAPHWLSFALAGVAAIWVLWRWRNPEHTLRAAYFAAGTALVWLTFFAWAKQSYCNYYFLAIGVFCAAIALWPREPDSESAN